MLLCSLPGAGGPGGAEPEPRDQREPPTTDGTSEDRLVPHVTPQPITYQHGGKDEKTCKQTYHYKRKKKAMRKMFK